MEKSTKTAAAIAAALVAAAFVGLAVSIDGKPDFDKYVAERPVCVDIEGSDEFWCPLPGQKARARTGPGRLIDECSAPVCTEPGKPSKVAAPLDTKNP